MSDEIDPQKKCHCQRNNLKKKLDSEIIRLNSEVKTLKSKVKRKETKVNALSIIIDNLKEKALIDETTAVRLKDRFSGTTLELIKNQLMNQ